jgi:CheY-like chemotaxis protein
MAHFEILVVDNNEDDYIVVRNAFEDLSLGEYKVVHLMSGRKLLDYLAHIYLAGQLYPHLILLDINMAPVDGITVLQMIKADELFRKIPIIMYSTIANADERNKCLQLGAKAFVTKQGNYYKTLAFVSSLDRFLRNPDVRVDLMVA